MFWGLIMEPNKRYTQVVEKPFHISQAAMDVSTGDNESCQVMVVVDGKNFLICTLQKNRQIQVPLDLYFKSGDSVSFLTNGKCNVHLTGYLDPEFEDDVSEEDEEEEDEEEEVPELVPAKNKRKLNDSKEGVANKKIKQEKINKKKPAEDDSSDEDGEDQLQKLLDGDDVDTDENDESYKLNTTAEAEADSDEEESEDEDGDGEEEDGDEEDEDDDEDEENDSQADSSLNNSKEESKVDTSNLSKSQKKRLKKKLAQQGKEKPQLNGVDKAKKAEPQKAKEDKKKPEKETPVEKKEKKVLSGGVHIEDTKVGAGAAAKPGKQVMVYYEGRLKSNNKIFDNCNKGPGFKFRLGAKEVIGGWDVGINGMKVGGKRRIVCPPAMGYGAKGSPPVIPPNSTLIFDVELKNVK